MSTRIALGIEMLTPIPERPWGRVTALAEAHGVSRPFLYELRDRAFEALCAALAPRQPGPAPQAHELRIDRDFIRRAITVLPWLKGTVRDIQLGLALLFQVDRSVGYISETLQAAGTAAATANAGLVVPQAILGEADEIFQGRRPCLTVVDGRSFLVLHLGPAENRDSTTWGVTFLDLLARGLQFQDLASDGATGIRAGAREAHLRVPLRPDLFHLLREATRLGQQLERAAYQALAAAERVRRAEREAQRPTRRRGRPLQVPTTRADAEAREQQAITTYDLYTWLIAEVRRGLEPLNAAGRLTTAAQARATIQTAVALLRDLGAPAVTRWAAQLLARLEELVAPLTWLDESLAAWRQALDADTADFLGWAWVHREALALDVSRDLPAALRPAAQALGEVMTLFHRSSSLAESLHSWLRPYLQIHRGLPDWLTPLLQWFWNHHEFQRGKRAGHSPLALAGNDAAPPLAEALAQLLGAARATPVAEPVPAITSGARGLLPGTEGASAVA